MQFVNHQFLVADDNVALNPHFEMVNQLKIINKSQAREIECVHTKHSYIEMYAIFSELHLYCVYEMRAVMFNVVIIIREYSIEFPPLNTAHTTHYAMFCIFAWISSLIYCLLRSFFCTLSLFRSEYSFNFDVRRMRMVKR